MEVNCIGHDGYIVFRLPRSVEAPRGWVVRETQGVIGDRYRVAECPSDARPPCSYLPWVPVRETREEAEGDMYPWQGRGDLAYGAVVEFPLGGYVWYQTGLKDRNEAEESARQAMARVRVALGLGGR